MRALDGFIDRTGGSNQKKVTIGLKALALGPGFETERFGLMRSFGTG
jgi:hypothetical protein